MQNLRPAFAVATRHIFAHLPIHRRFQAILHSHRAAFDKQVALQRRQTDHALECPHKFSVAFRVNVRVRDFDFRRALQIALSSGLVEVRMIKPDWHRTEEPVEIDQLAIINRIVQI